MIKALQRCGVIVASIMLGGCFDDVSDIKAFMAEVDRNTPRGIQPMPAVKEFAHIEYTGKQGRSPFAQPKAEAIQDRIAEMQDCLQPDRTRAKESLEKYALANLKMKGTMGYEGDPWALIEAKTDGSLHRVSVGNFIGLFHGRITAVSNTQVKLIELVPDGTGCWKERETIVDINEDVSSQ